MVTSYIPFEKQWNVQRKLFGKDTTTHIIITRESIYLPTPSPITMDNSTMNNPLHRTRQCRSNTKQQTQLATMTVFILITMMTHTSSAFTISSWNVDQQQQQRQQHLAGRNVYPYEIPRQPQQQLFSMKSKPGDTAAKVEAQRQEIKLPSTTSDELPLLYNNENDVKFEKDVAAVVESSGDLLWRGVVVVLCALWASNFAAGKLVLGVDGVDSSLYAVSRFGLAALALVPGSIAAVRSGAIDWATARGAAVCGSWVAFGYLGQTLGLLTTTASRSCVICSMHCVFVAIIAEFTRISRLSSEDESSSFDLKRLIPAGACTLFAE